MADRQHETDAAHNEAMKRQQAEHRARMREKSEPEQGLLMVNTGDGKGKSTAGFGTAIRALGWGHKVGIVQFVKGAWKTGEKEFFKRYPDLVDMRVMGDGFTWDTQDRAQDIVSAEKAWAQSRAMMESGTYDFVLLDELNIVLRYEYLDVEEVLAGLAARAKRTSVMVTGRNAPEPLLSAADLVSEIKAVRHPFENGIKAKQGIDY